MSEYILHFMPFIKSFMNIEYVFLSFIAYHLLRKGSLVKGRFPQQNIPSFLAM
jgi:hypothetical protein